MESVEIDNIWYGKRADRGKKLEFPKDEKRGGSNPFICIHYARNECLNKDCQFIHRIPIEEDVFPTTRDCFGREKFADYKDDMSGVGQLNSVNKTIWISPLKLREMELYKVMSNYGEIESVNVIREMAFVCFKLEGTAQFVREAIDGKKLDDDAEPLRVRWARDHEENGGDLKKLAIELLEKLQNGKRKREPIEEDQLKIDDNSLVTLSKIVQRKKPIDSLQVLAGYSSSSSDSD